MKNTQLFFALLILFSQFELFSQTRNERKPKENKITKEVDKANQTVKDTNESIKNAVATSKETIGELKETISFLFPKKNKNKTKGIVSIHITQVEYDAVDLNQLYKAITKAKGIKKPSKSFENNIAIIKVSYKKSVDDLWQKVPEHIRKAFKMVKMDHQTMLVNWSKK